MTPQVKSVLLNLRSTVKFATMGLQWPHAIYRGLVLWTPPSLHPSFSPHLPKFSSHVLLKLYNLWAIKWQTCLNYCNVITRAPRFLFFPLVPSPVSSPHVSFPRGSKWGQIFSLLLCNLIRAMTLVAAYKTEGDSWQSTPSCTACPPSYSHSFSLRNIGAVMIVTEDVHNNVVKNEFQSSSSMHATGCLT